MQHKDVLTEEDKVRLNSYFADVLEADDTYNMARHFGLRGGEVFAKLKKKTDIEIRTSEDGNEFFVLNTDFLTKNSKGGIQSNEFQTCGMIRDNVQVRAMKRFLALLPHPSQGSFPESSPWCTLVQWSMVLQCSAWTQLSFSDDAFVVGAGRLIHRLHKPLY